MDRMGEKPLSIDETSVPTTTMGGVPPLVGSDTPPPGTAAGSILTTRSNIKSGGAGPVVNGPGGPSLDDPLPPDTSGAVGIITTRSNIKSAAGGMDGGEVADAGDASPTVVGASGGTTTGDPLPPDTSNAGSIITTRSNIKGAAGGLDGGEVADAGDATTTDGGAGGGTTDDPVPPDTSGATAINTTRSNIKNAGGMQAGEAGGDATPADDAPGVAGAGQPIPGVDVIVKQHPR